MTHVQALFSGNLRALRQRIGLSQADLAEEIKVSQSHIAQLESGKRFPSAQTLEKLASALGVEAFELFVGPEQMENASDKEGLIRRLEMMRRNIDEMFDESIHRMFPPPENEDEPD